MIGEVQCRDRSFHTSFTLRREIGCDWSSLSLTNMIMSLQSATTTSAGKSTSRVSPQHSGKSTSRVSPFKSDETENEIEKDYRRQKYNRNRRKNTKEEKKRLYKERIRSRNQVLRRVLLDTPHAIDTDEIQNIMQELKQSSSLLQQTALNKDYDFVVRHIESAIFLAIGVARSRDWIDILVALGNYIKNHSKQSFFATFSDVLAHVVGDKQLDTPHGFSFTSIYDQMRGHQEIGMIWKLITIATSVAACHAVSVDWEKSHFQLIMDNVNTQTFNITTVLDCVVHSLDWLVSTGIACFRKRSLEPLLFSNQHAQRVNDEYMKVTRWHEEVRYGSAESKGGPSVNEHSARVDSVYDDYVDMMKTTNNTFMKRWLEGRVKELLQWKQDCSAMLNASTMRERPIAFSIFGSSGVGKSTVSPLIMNSSLAAMGHSTESQYQATVNENDKYDSTIKSNTLGVFLDDIGNTKSKFMSNAPTERVIAMCNNIAVGLVKADLNEKGKMFHNEKVLICTTNVKDLQAPIYSNEPASILRRMYHITQSVKPQYCVSGGTSLNTNHPDLAAAAASNTVADVWEFTVERVYPMNGVSVWEILTEDLGNGPALMQNINITDLLKLVIKLSKRHKAEQSQVLQLAQTVQKAKCCKHCCMPSQQMCICVAPAQYEPHAEEMISRITTHAVGSVIRNFNPFRNFWFLLTFRFWIGKSFESMATRELTRFLQREVGVRAENMLWTYMPSWLYNQRGMQLLRTFSHSAVFRHSRISKTCMWIVRVLFLVSLLKSQSLGLLMFLLLMMGELITWRMRYTTYQRAMDEFQNRRDALTTYAQTVRDDPWITSAAFVSLGLVILGVRIYRNRAHGLDDPREVAKAPAWDFGWFSSVGKRTKVNPISVSSTPPEVIKRVENNIVRMVIEAGDTRSSCNAIVVRKSVIVFPKHMIVKDKSIPDGPKNEYKEDMTFTFTRSSKTGGTWKVQHVNRNDLFEVDTSLDLVAMFVPNCPDVRDITSSFVRTPVTGRTLAHMLVRDSDGVMNTYDLTWKAETVGTTFKSNLSGGSYVTPGARNGSCCGLIVSNDKQPAIIGLHIGGNEYIQRGISMTLTSTMLERLYSQMERTEVLSAHGSEMPDEIMGKKVLESTEVHTKCTRIKTLESDRAVDVYGSTKLRAHSKSCVKQSILSEHVEEICGVPNRWGPPQLEPNWKAYNANLEIFSQPAHTFPRSLLNKAKNDYLRDLIPLVHKYQKIMPEKAKIRVLTDEETINGVPGVRFLDPVKMNTSMGAPVFGAKNRQNAVGETVWFDTFLEDIPNGDVKVSYRCGEILQEEINRLETCWLRGERGYPITSATLKDEPTPVDKDKVRVFQCAPMALSFHIRKYFLSIAAFLHNNPLVAETAVGVNAFGKDWQELMEHVRKYAYEKDGEIQLCGWDYKSYDVRMNSQLTRKAWQIFIDLAQMTGYDETSLTIMRNMIVDITHPLIDFNGTLLMSFNMNTSGNNMTVDVNGVVGSLLVRMFVLTEYPDVNVRDVLSALTYGDDFLGSRKEEYDKITFLGYRSFLRNHGMEITHPAKDGREPEMLQISDADFLKRTSVYLKEICREIGKLSEKSIFKSLHSNLASKNASDQEVAAACIDTALHEWFAFGKDHYEMRREQMQEIARKAGIAELAIGLSIPFEERVRIWQQKYDPEN